MRRYVALLRGINVGGNRKVDMKTIVCVCESKMFKNVSTYINSGNILFESATKDKDALAHKMELILKKTFGFNIPVVVRSASDIKKVVGKIPAAWTNDVKQKTDVLFLWDTYDNKKTLDLIRTKSVDHLIYVAGSIVWNLDKKDYNKSGMRYFIGTDVYKHMTARNVNTVRKLLELLKK